MLGLELQQRHEVDQSRSDDDLTWTNSDEHFDSSRFWCMLAVGDWPDLGTSFDATRAVEQGWRSRSLVALHRRVVVLVKVVLLLVNEDVNKILRNVFLLAEELLLPSPKWYDDGALKMVNYMTVDGARSCAKPSEQLW